MNIDPEDKARLARAYVERLDDRRVVASISGGKDSAAMSLWLRELGIDHDRVFMDTGWEHPKTYEYLRGELSRVIGPIIEISAGETLAEMSMRKGIFPSRRKRWCTEKLKLEPLRAYIAGLQDAGFEVVNAVGVRAQESAKRAQMLPWEWSDGLDCETWRPLLTWKFESVRDIHALHGLSPNPLYLMGAERVGCFPCIHAGRRELQLLGRIWPERVGEIRKLERLVTETASKIVEARGEKLIHPRTLLRERAPSRPAGIDAQMTWAGTAELDLFYEEEPGCMRWGLCDTGADDPE